MNDRGNGMDYFEKLSGAGVQPRYLGVYATQAALDAEWPASSLGNGMKGSTATVAGTQKTWGGSAVGWKAVAGGKNVLRWFANRKRQGVLDVMPTPPTVTSGATATLAKELDGVAVISGMKSGLTRVSRFGLITPYSGDPTTTAYDGTRGLGVGGMPGAVQTIGSGFIGMIHYGQNIEFKFWTNTDGIGAYSRVMFGVDDGNGIKWTSASAAYLTPESGNVFYKLAFSTIAKRTIYVTGASRLSAIYGDANDVLVPAPRVGPRTMFVTDSFGGPTAMTTLNNGYFAYPRFFANALGMNDVNQGSMGGSSWQSSDYRNINLRIDYDIAPANPDLIIFGLGRNDNGGLQKSVVDNALDYCIQKCPNAAIVVLGMMWDDGPEYWTAGNIEAYNAIKNSALERSLPYIDTMQIPETSSCNAWTAGCTLGASASIGATSLTVTKPLSTGMAIQIDSEICFITAVSAATVTISKALTSAHANGAAITILGVPLVTGNGYNYTGTGSAAKMFGADNTHPTDEGNIMYGEYYAQALVEYCTRMFS